MKKVKIRKILIILIVLVLITFILLKFVLIKPQENSNKTNFTFIRTTRLAKTSLEDSISATGLVESNNVSNVTTTLETTVKSINVSVGDYVNEGDIICVLDTANLLKKIERAEESLNDNIENAQEKYNDAVKDYKDWIKKVKETTNYDNASDYFSYLKNLYENEAMDTTSRSNAYNTYMNAITNYNKLLDAKDEALENLEEAQTSETLEDLYDDLDDYTLKAETSGYITALNVTVGSKTTNTIATIQDIDDLIISISVAEYDIKNVALGMKAIITSDSIDGEVEGVVSQISPVASGGKSSSATFPVEVSVLNGSNGLIIGVNAKVKLIISSVDNVYMVPIDAIEEENGNSYVYLRKNKSEEFNKVEVETGFSNDYYIEISSDELQDGYEVRSSANEDESTFKSNNSESQQSGLFGAMSGMNLGQSTNSGNRNNRNNFGPPSGGPSGMPGGF